MSGGGPADKGDTSSELRRLSPKYCVYDIETVPQSEIAHLWEPSAESSKPGAGDPVAPVWAHRVIAIGMLRLDEDLMPIEQAHVVAGANEAAIVSAWARCVTAVGRPTNVGPRPMVLVDFNGRAFDMPVLQTRAYRYGIPLDWYFGRLPDNRGEISQWSKEYRDRYGGLHLDLRELWTNHGGFAATKLEHLARLMGLPGKLGFDGRDVAAAFAAGEQRRIEAYCVSDVYTTALVFARIRLLAGRMSRAEYRAAVGAMMGRASQDPDQSEFVAGIDRAQVLLESEGP